MNATAGNKHDLEGSTMTQIVSFSTAGLDPRRKAAYWNEHACESFSPVVSVPVDIRTFDGWIARTAIGDMMLADVYSEAQVVQHSRAHVARTRSPLFFLHLQLEGESISRQDGREAHLKAGDFTLCDSTRHYQSVFPGRNRLLVLGIPDAWWRFRCRARPECAACFRACCGTIGWSAAGSSSSQRRPASLARSWTCSALHTPNCRVRSRIVPPWRARIASGSSTTLKCTWTPRT